MKINQKYILYGVIGLLIALLLFSVKRCKEESYLKDSANKVLSSKVEYYKNKLGSKTATIDVLETDNKTLKKEILKKDDSLNKLASDFSKVISIVKAKEEIKIDSIGFTFDEPFDCEFTKFGRHDTKWFSFLYQVDNKGFVLDDIRLKNETTVLTGFKRKWFLGKRSLKTDITNSNPYFKTTEIQSTTVKIPVKFYDTRLFNIGVGILLGKLISDWP